MNHRCFRMLGALVVLFMSMTMTTASAENWLQLQGDALRSGNSTAELPQTIGLIGSIALSDGVYASPVVANDVVYVVDGSGVVWALDEIGRAHV